MLMYSSHALTVTSPGLRSCATETTTHTWIFSRWLRPIDEQASDADFLSGSRNAPSWQAYSTLLWKCARRTKEHSSSIRVWVIAPSLTFPVTTKVLKRRSAWIGICRRSLWTKAVGHRNTCLERWLSLLLHSGTVALDWFVIAN